ncbi:MAG: hypothetical protein KBA46_03435 [Candidatus Omnitrophica bacterium]|nr:hypothetical protein [Candidatus Omnitrophota bacterium]
MITLDFSFAIAIYTLGFSCVVLVVWLFSNKQREQRLSLDPRFIWFCSVCSYTYINTKEDLISTCPRCSSYNKK